MGAENDVDSVEAVVPLLVFGAGGAAIAFTQQEMLQLCLCNGDVADACVLLAHADLSGGANFRTLLRTPNSSSRSRAPAH
jgi:hypothetical protein